MRPMTKDSPLTQPIFSDLAKAGDLRLLRAEQHSTIESSSPWEMVYEEVATGHRANVSLLPAFTTWEEVVEAGAVQARRILGLPDA